MKEEIKSASFEIGFKSEYPAPINGYGLRKKSYFELSFLKKWMGSWVFSIVYINILGYRVSLFEIGMDSKEDFYIEILFFQLFVSGIGINILGIWDCFFSFEDRKLWRG